MIAWLFRIPVLSVGAFGAITPAYQSSEQLTQCKLMNTGANLRSVYSSLTGHSVTRITKVLC